MAKGKPLTDRQRSALRVLRDFADDGGRWYMAAGSVGEFGITLAALAHRGMVERRPATGPPGFPLVYRITPAGRDALAGG